MTLEEARKLAQDGANEDGFNRLVFMKDGEFLVVTQELGVEDPPDAEFFCREERCDNCGRTVSLHDYEESGEGWDHTPAGTFCDRCRVTMIGDI